MAFGGGRYRRGRWAFGRSSQIPSAHTPIYVEFRAGFLGLQVAMDIGWFVAYVSPDNRIARASVVNSISHRPQASDGRKTAKPGAAEQTAGPDSFIFTITHRCPAAAELGR